MAKKYTTVVVEGRTLTTVRGALKTVIGGALEPWSEGHLLGIHLDCSDVSDAIRYGMAFDEPEAPVPDYPVVEVDLFSTQGNGATLKAQKALAELLCLVLGRELGVDASVRHHE